MSNTPLPAQLNEEPRSDDGLRRSTHLYLAVGMALLIGLLVASYMQASAGLDALKEFGLMNQRADHLDRLSQLLVEAQSSVRGYALTREPAYFNAYKSVRPKIHDTLEIIKRDEQDGAQAGSVEQLIKRAENLAARMELTARHVEGGIALDTNWFAQDSLAMDAYRQQQATMKVALLTRNLQNVKQSTNGFENARLSAIVLAGASLLLLMLVVSQQQKKQDLREKSIACWHRKTSGLNTKCVAAPKN